MGMIYTVMCNKFGCLYQASTVNLVDAMCLESAHPHECSIIPECDNDYLT